MTEAQLIANRANAQFSTGPRTEEGKNRSSLNAFRHGLTGQIVIHTPEDQSAFQKHCDAIRQELAPVGALETTLAQAIAEDYWRLNRARALEDSIFTLGLQEHSDPEASNSEVDAALAQGRTWIEQARNLQLLTTYEQRIRRSIEKNTAELRTLQAARKAAIEQAEERARLLVQLAEYEAKHGRNYDPSNDFPPESQPLGSVFSKPSILRRLECDKRLKQAGELDWRGYLKSDEEESDDSSTRKQRPEPTLTLPTIYVRMDD
jgi:hypothetical protein